MSQRSAEQDEADISLFKEYLRIDTRHPHPDFAKCETLYRKWASELGAEFQIVECERGWPNYILTIKGANPELPAIALCCHTDVVPVVEKLWTALPPGETPFSAWESQDGRIYARGAQDMKVVGAGEVCALRALKEQNGGKLQFLRNVVLIFMPDEEVGGARGMAKLVHSEEFKKMNIGFSLDEGLAHDEDEFVIFTGERTPLWVSFCAKGPMGHGAKFLSDPDNLADRPAMDRLARIVERMTKLRDESLAKVKAGADLGDVTTFNWNAAEAGVITGKGTPQEKVAVNVIPREGKVTFDVRITYHEFNKVTEMWKEWAKELDLEIKFEAGHDTPTPSPYSSTKTAGFQILKENIASFGNVRSSIFPAATDSRYLRRVGVSAFGISFMRRLPSLLHDHNEYCPRSTFLEGVQIYSKVIPALAMASGDLNAPMQPQAASRL